MTQHKCIKVSPITSYLYIIFLQCSKVVFSSWIIFALLEQTICMLQYEGFFFVFLQPWLLLFSKDICAIEQNTTKSLLFNYNILSSIHLLLKYNLVFKIIFKGAEGAFYKVKLYNPLPLNLNHLKYFPFINKTSEFKLLLSKKCKDNKALS